MYMYPMCQYYCCCPYLTGMRMQERQCMSKPAMYDVIKKATVPETYYITFNAPLNSQNGIYHLWGIAGDPSYFAFNAFNSKGQRFLFYGTQICSVQLRGPKKPYILTPPQKVAPEVPGETEQEPGTEEISQLTESVTCWYNGKQYSEGAQVDVGGGKKIRCNWDGKWYPM